MLIKFCCLWLSCLICLDEANCQAIPYCCWREESLKTVILLYIWLIFIRNIMWPLIKQLKNFFWFSVPALPVHTLMALGSDCLGISTAADTLTWLETHGLVTADQSSLVTSMLDSGQMVVLTGNSKRLERTNRRVILPKIIHGVLGCYRFQHEFLLMLLRHFKFFRCAVY